AVLTAGTVLTAGAVMTAGAVLAAGTVLTAGVGAVLIGGVLAAVDEAQPFLTVTVVDEDDDEFGIDDRHRLVSGDGNGEVREVVQPGAQGRGADVLELGQRPRRGLLDRKSTRPNSSPVSIWYAAFCLKKRRDGTT